jgi:Holliday junction resolvase
MFFLHQIYNARAKEIGYGRDYFTKKVTELLGIQKKYRNKQLIVNQEEANLIAEFIELGCKITPDLAFKITELNAKYIEPKELITTENESTLQIEVANVISNAMANLQEQIHLIYNRYQQKE